MATTLHNRDATRFLGQALMYLHQTQTFRPDGAYTLMWHFGGESQVMAAIPGAVKNEDYVALCDRITAIGEGASMGADEQITLLQTRFRDAHRYRTAFTLTLQNGEPTLLVSEHIRQRNGAMLAGTVPVRAFVTDIYYDDPNGGNTKIPDAVMGFFRAIVDGVEAPPLDGLGLKRRKIERPLPERLNF